MEQLLPKHLTEEELMKPIRRRRARKKKNKENFKQRMAIIEKKMSLSFHSLQSGKLSSEIKPDNAVKEGEEVRYAEPSMELNSSRKKKKNMERGNNSVSKKKYLPVITNAEGSCLDENAEVGSDKINEGEIDDETSKAAAFALLMISNSRAADEACLESAAETTGSKKKKKKKNESSAVINSGDSCLEKNAESGLDKNNEKKVEDRASKTNLQKTDGTCLEPAVKSTGSKKKRRKNASEKTSFSPVISTDGNCLDKNAEVPLDKINEKKANDRPSRTDLQATEGTSVESAEDCMDSRKKKMKKIESEKNGPSPLHNAESSCLGKKEEVTSERINENKTRDKASGIDKHSMDRICVGYAADSTDSKKKKKNASEKKGPSADTNADGSCLAEVVSDKINENEINDRPSKIDQQMVDGTCPEFAVGTTEKAKSRQSCDCEYADISCVSTQFDDNVEMKCLSVGSSGKKPMISEVSTANEVGNRHSKQYRRMKQQARDSKDNLVDDSSSQGQANQSSMEKCMESEILAWLNEVEYKYRRRGQKRKEHLQELKNNSDFPKHELEFSVINVSMNEKLEPLQSVSQKPKLKYKYLKHDLGQKQKDPVPVCPNNLVGVKLEVMDSSQVLSGRSKEESHKFAEGVNNDTAVMSEEPETCSHASPVTNVRNAAVSIELPGKMDLSCNVIKEEASDKALLVVSYPTSQQCLDGESGLKFKEEITGEKPVNDGHKSLQANATMKHSPVREAAATVSLMEECNSAYIHLETDGAAVEKVSGRDSWSKVEKPLVRLRKKLLVLDLNGLLVDILYVSNVTHRAYRRIAGKSAFKRPFCDQFLDFCFEAFDIGVWSSRMRCNVDAAVDYIMGDRKHRLLFSWDQCKCTKTGYKTIENSHKPLVLKELQKLWNKEERNLPWEEGAYSPSNTLLIDDSPYKALCNPPHTAIFPHPFNFENEQDKSLGPEGDIRTYLEGLAKADDVQEYVKENPFGQKSIAEDHPSWTFYLRVIERVKGLDNGTANQ